MAKTGSEQRRASRRRLLTRGAALGAAAFGVPALANALIARRAATMEVADLPEEDDWEHVDWDSPLGRVRLRVLGSADRECLVFLHSLGPGTSSRQWLATGAAMARNWRVVLVDDLGWGDSGRPVADYGLETSVAVLGALAQGQLGAPFHLIAGGESAPVALAASRRLPGIRSIALSGPAGVRLLDERGGSEERLLDVVLRTPVLGTSAVNAYTRRRAIDQNLRRHRRTTPPPELVDLRYHLSHLPGSERALSAFLRGRYEAHLADLDVPPDLPVWIGWGRLAVGEPVEDADLWLAHLPDAELTVFEQAASHPHVDQPRQTATELERFLRGARRRGR